MENRRPKNHLKRLGFMLGMIVLALVPSVSAHAGHTQDLCDLDPTQTYVRYQNRMVQINMGQLDNVACHLVGDHGTVQVYVNTGSEWRPDWELFANVPYRNGYRDGRMSRFRTGNARGSYDLLQVTPYDRGEVDGRVVRYDSQGRVIRTVDFRDDYRHGWEIDYDYRADRYGNCVRVETDRVRWVHGERDFESVYTHNDRDFVGPRRQSNTTFTIRIGNDDRDHHRNRDRHRQHDRHDRNDRRPTLVCR